ncbi:benzoylformate decarboxylase [Bordetella petrii]|uniref:benzoylformate decarboxylase n=1 Tax=Bordetella petrii TaxID=94624 RepID=UPI001A977C2B|nr:benzoylformate decarboxylase [Bordetella petrii]MBO1110861.1 benzoylformate decarboxylase [Bordetella petrii]
MNTSHTRTPTVREAVYEVMRAFGASKIFGNPGSTELPMFRDFPADFEYVLGLQEAAVVGMADGYAVASGKVAFVNLHSAAGVGNGMGNIYTAFKNRTPLVIIAGQQSRAILPFDPYLASERAAELPQPYVKWSIEPARAADVPFAVATACRRALQAPCGPVLVSVPADDWDQPAAGFVPPRMAGARVGPDPDAIAGFGLQLARCARPAFVVGAEVDRDGAWADVVALAERHQAGVYTAPMTARGAFPEDHPLFMGFLPAAREPIAKQLAGHDLILAIGAPVFTYHIEGEGPHVPEGAALLQLTEDMASAARLPVGEAVVGSVQLSVRALLAAARDVPARQPPPARPRAARIEPGSPLSVPYVLQTLADLRDPASVIVEEAPTARVVMHAHLPMLRPASFYTMASGGLGYGIAAAVGIAAARPRDRVVAVIGDGSAMYSIQALWTAVQLRLDVTFLILNNRRYAAMVRFAGVLGFDRGAQLPGTDIDGIDFVALAQGLGCAASRVEEPGELAPALQHALHSNGPHLLELMVA